MVVTGNKRISHVSEHTLPFQYHDLVETDYDCQNNSSTTPSHTPTDNQLYESHNHIMLFDSIKEQIFKDSIYFKISFNNFFKCFS